MKIFLPLSIIFFLVFTCFAVAAQVKFSASVSAAQISKNEMVQLRLLLENASEVEQITPPTFGNFILISGPNQESGMTAVNGVVKQYVALNFVLKPKAPGNYTFGAATAKAGGKKFTSNTIGVKVTNTLAPDNGSNNSNSPFAGISPYDAAPAQTQFTDYILKKGENPAEKINRNMFVQLQTDKTFCYTGQPIVATYKLFTRLKSESNVIKNPSFNGFSVIDLQQPDNTNYTREKVNGREYNVYIIRKVQLYPLQAGKLELEPLEVENKVHFIKEAYANKTANGISDMMQEFADAAIPPEGVETQDVVLQSKPVNITVAALPSADLLTGFNGAVGNFTVETLLEKNIFTTEDAGKLRLIISGEGNLQLVNNPDVQWPMGIEAFEPVAVDEFVTTTVPVSGRKIIDYSFTVVNPGTYTIPAVTFSYFSTTDKKYKTAVTKPIEFSVTKGNVKKIPQDTTTFKKDTTGFLNKFINNRRWVISTVVALVLCGLIFWLKKDRREEKVLQAEMAEKEAAVKTADALAAATALAEEKDWMEKPRDLLYSDSAPLFYIELNTAIKNYLAQKLHLPAQTITKKSIAEALDKKNIAVATAINLLQLLNEIELQLYTPFAEQEKMETLYKQTADMIQLLETYKG